jgi:hypothetical protein
MYLNVFERSQYFIQTDPDLQGIANDFTPDMFTATGMEKLEPLTDGFTYFQLIQKNMNTRTQYMSANITLPPQEQFLTVQRSKSLMLLVILV